MSGGGGGDGPAPVDNSLQIAQMNAQKAKEDQANQDAALTQRRSEFYSNLDTAKKNATDRATALIQQRGLDPNKFDIGTALNSAQTRIPDLDPNPAQYFSDDVINNLLNSTENNTRSKNATAVNNTLKPGWERSYVPDNAADSYINEILGQQQDSATKSIQAAKDRGQLTDLGFAGASSKLGDQATGARSTLTNLGTSVIGKDRSNLDAIRDRAVEGANSYTLGSDDFNLDPYMQELASTNATQTGNLKGDILNSLGGTKLFNVNDILLQGGTQQGPQNLTTTGGGGVIPKKSALTDRGLASGGVF